ncbi:Centromere Protein C, partial [Manis pentadactyla]
ITQLSSKDTQSVPQAKRSADTEYVLMGETLSHVQSRTVSGDTDKPALGSISPM